MNVKLYLTLANLLAICLSSQTFQRIKSPLRLKFLPLIEGPTWLPIHVSVYYISERTEIDFIPINGTDFATVLKLVSGRNVPGLIRVTKQDSNESVKSIRRSHSIKKIQEILSYNTNMNLYFNNCYHFAFHCFTINNLS